MCLWKLEEIGNTTLITRAALAKKAFLEDLSTVAVRNALSMILRNLCLTVIPILMCSAQDCHFV